MPSRPIASGTIFFGLVAIPVRVYASIDSSKRIRSNQLHQKYGTGLRQQKNCPVCQEVVSREDIFKGHEFSKGQYILFSPEELEGLLTKPTHAIEISQFVPLTEMDPVSFERSYYPGPDQGVEKPYRLPAQALQETGFAALGKYASTDSFGLETFRDEIRDGLLQLTARKVEGREVSAAPEAAPKLSPLPMDQGFG